MHYITSQKKKIQEDELQPRLHYWLYQQLTPPQGTKMGTNWIEHWNSQLEYYGLDHISAARVLTASWLWGNTQEAGSVGSMHVGVNLPLFYVDVVTMHMLLCILHGYFELWVADLFPAVKWSRWIDKNVALGLLLAILFLSLIGVHMWYVGNAHVPPKLCWSHPCIMQ